MIFKEKVEKKLSRNTGNSAIPSGQNMMRNSEISLNEIEISKRLTKTKERFKVFPLV